MSMHLRSAFLCAATALCVASAPKAANLEHFKGTSETSSIAWAAEILSLKETKETIRPEIGLVSIPTGYSYPTATGKVQKFGFDEVETLLITINRIREYVEGLKFGGSIKSRETGKWSISLNVGVEKHSAIIFKSVIMGEASVPFTKLISGVLFSPRLDANVKIHF